MKCKEWDNTTCARTDFLPNINSNFLNLGCGLNAPQSWLNVDGSLQAAFARWPRLKSLLVSVGIYPRSQAAIVWPRNVLRLDLRYPLPFADGRFEAVYSSHTFEHLYRDQAAALTRECHRVLKSGGICRILVPDLAAAVAQYQASSSDDEAADRLLDRLLMHPRSQAKGLLAMYHRIMNAHQHKWMYDGHSLAFLLRAAGFSDLKMYHSVQGELPGLTAIEDPSRIENGAGVAVEGTKR